MNNKPEVVEQKIEISDNNLHKRLFDLLLTSGELIKPQGIDAQDFVWAGGITAHAFIKQSKFGGNDIVGVQFVTIPFLSKLPENAASMMLDQIRKDMKNAYGKGDKGIQ
jgi:hypothetical protein